MSAVDYSDIAGDLERIAVGGEGVVYRLRSRPALVFKEYKEQQRPSLNGNALASLISRAEALPPPDRQRIATRTVWPRQLVLRNGDLQGFLMPCVDDAFYRRYGLRANPKRVLCDWNQLIYHHEGVTLQPHMLSEVPVATQVERLQLLGDLATTLDVLHRSSFVVGDMSGKNLLWAVNPIRVVFIDCDSFREAGTAGVCGHKESPGWVDPSLQGAPTTQQSDIYKLGVAAYRALVHDPSGTVSPTLVRQRGVVGASEELVQLLEASVGSPASRPTAAEWVRRLDDVVRFDGRPRISASNTQPHGQPRPRPRLVLSPVLGGST